MMSCIKDIYKDSTRYFRIDRIGNKSDFEVIVRGIAYTINKHLEPAAKINFDKYAQEALQQNDKAIQHTFSAIK